MQALSLMQAVRPLCRPVPYAGPDPKDYRYCGYAEALAKGCPLPRQGICTVLGLPETTSWDELSRQYRTYLFVKGSSNSADRPPAFDLASAQRVVEQQKVCGSVP
jgi:hypothetical protein